MLIRFWGTRGSIAKPGADTVRYGGNTSCVELRSDSGTLVLLDCGTGAHGLGVALEHEEEAPRGGHILVTHTHWDHIQGFPFFAPLFRRHDRWQVYGPRGLGPTLRDTFSGQMQYTYFPVSIDQLQARVDYRDLVEGSFDIGDIRVTAQYLNHPSLTLGYRLEVDGLVVVYATDHEPHASHLAAGGRPPAGGEDERHLHFCRDADLLIHDAQYTYDEYRAKIGWGHSTIEYAIDSAIAAGADRLALFHHDPLRNDAGVDALLARARQRASDARASLEVRAATEGEAIVLSPGRKARARTGTFPAAMIDDAPRASVHDQSVVVAVSSKRIRRALCEAAGADGVGFSIAEDVATLRREIARRHTALVLLSRTFDGRDALELCRELGAKELRAVDIPLVIVARDKQVERLAGNGAGVADWLVVPCTPQYARTRIRAWVLRAACRWERAAVPDDETQRLSALHRLQLLDTEPEERFDRYTRIASALFKVPVALVSLVDRDRQWFKSRRGMPVSETSRDMAFCAHAIMDEDMLLVEDALLDVRFADNPLVTQQRIRFYAGMPLTLDGGARVGTLCLMDHRPRRLDDSERELLRDLARLVEVELAA